MNKYQCIVETFEVHVGVMSGSVLCLQDVSRWDSTLCGSLFSDSVSSCAVFVSHDLMGNFRGQGRVGNRNYAVVLGTILVVSCYLPNSWLESRKRETCCDLMLASLDELDELIQVMKGKHIVESLIICGDFQVSLPSTEGIIGPCVMGGNKYPSERELLVVEFLERHQLRAANTYVSSERFSDELWTFH